VEKMLFGLPYSRTWILRSFADDLEMQGAVGTDSMEEFDHLLGGGLYLKETFTPCDIGE
jgi:hypothetical protein